MTKKISSPEPATDKHLTITLGLVLLTILVDAWRNPEHTILSAVVVAIALSTIISRRK